MTKEQLERRVKNALVFVPKDKSYSAVYLYDHGMKVEVTEDAAVISTNYHKHVFDRLTSAGISRPYIYSRKFVETVIKYKSYATDSEGNFILSKLLDYLKSCKEDADKRSDYDFCTYYTWWSYNIFSNLYSIGEKMVDSVIVYLTYLANVGRDSILLSEKPDGMTAAAFIDSFIDTFKKLVSSFREGEDSGMVLFEPKTDEQVAKETIESLQEQEFEQNAQ